MRLIPTPVLLAAAAFSLTACSSGEDAAAPGEEAAVDASQMADQQAEVLNPNDATLDELTAIDGITPDLAQTIVNGRPYSDAIAFNTTLTGAVSADQANAIRSRVFVPVNLNTANEEAIRLIPGMTDKMVHEFEEYRPYSDMSVFEREIGKYVDQTEVARLRRYVTL